MSEKASATESQQSYSFNSSAMYSQCNDKSKESFSNENSFKSEEQQIYDFFTKTFERKFQTPEDVIKITSRTLKKFINLQTKLENANHKIEQMNEEMGNLVDKTMIADAEIKDDRNTVEIVTDKLRFYKKRVLQLQDSNTDKELKIKQLENKIEEMKLEHEKAVSELETQVKESKTQEAPNHSDCIQSTADIFEDFINSQEETIQKLGMQRSKLIEGINSYEKLNNCIEEKYQKLLEENEQNQKDFEELKKESSALKEFNSKIVETLKNGIPESLKSKVQESEDVSEYLSNILQLLAADREIKYEEDREVNIKDYVPVQRYKDLVSHLEDAAEFIKNLVSSSGDVNGEEVRNILMVQCGKINDFIEENMLDLGIDRLPKQYSIFNPTAFDGPEKQLEEFLKFATNEEMESSPVRELFSIFCGVTDVNTLLIDYINTLKKQIDENADSSLKIDVFKKLQNENFDLVQTRIQNEERIQKLENTLKELTGVEDVSDINVEVLNREIHGNEMDLQEKYDKVKKDFDDNLSESNKYKASTNEVLQNLREELEETKNSLENETKEHKKDSNKLSRENEKLTKDLKNVTERLTKENQELTEELNDKTIKCKEFSKLHKETCQVIDSIQRRTQRLLKENEKLADEMSKIQGVNTAQKEKIEAMEVVEKKLRDSRSKIKQRLIKAQKVNEQLIQEGNTKNENENKLANACQSTKNQAEEAIKEVEEKQEQLNKANEEISQLKKELAIGKAREKALSFKIASITRNAEDEKAVFDQKASIVEQKVKISNQRLKQETDEKVEKARNLLLMLANKEDEGETIDEAAALLRTKVSLYTAEKKILNDALETRRELGLKPSQTLYDVVFDRENSVCVFDKLKEETNELQDKINEIQEENTKLLKESKCNDEWLKWSVKMEKEISGSCLTTGSAEDSRNILAEAIRLGKGNNSTLSKLSVLRDEKKLLVKGIGNAKSSSKEPSLRSTINALRFLNRVQVESGHMHITIPGLSNFV